MISRGNRLDCRAVSPWVGIGACHHGALSSAQVVVRHRAALSQDVL